MSIDLTQYESEYNDQEGTYNVVITGFEKKQNNGKWSGIFAYRHSETGKTGRMQFPLQENCYWILSRMADAAGLSKDQKRSFDPTMLIKKEVCVTFAREEANNGKSYLQPDPKTFTRPQSANNPPAQTNMRDETPTQNIPQESSDPSGGSYTNPDEDDLPF